MKQLITIHSHNSDKRGGFESSQQNRMLLAKLLNIPYVHIITSPQNESFEEKFKKMGFTDAILVSLGRSLFGTDAIMENPYLYYYKENNKIIAKAFYDVDLKDFVTIDEIKIKKEKRILYVKCKICRAT